MNGLYPLSDDKIGQFGARMYETMRELYPICRSITGNGVRETLRILQREIPLTVEEVPSGTRVFDWTIPREWNFKEAYVKNSAGDKIIDAANTNLHLLNYSIPIRKKVSLEELKQHLFSLPDHPDWIPYRTSYYNDNWGFCISHKQFQELIEDAYEVFIDTSLAQGHLTYGEFFLKGESAQEVLISTHICHPSLCNDNLSGVILAAFLAKHLSILSLRFSYRFLFIPGTIGSITWLSLNEKTVPRIKHGLVAACVGDNGRFTYKKSRQQHAEIDRIVPHVLKFSGKAYDIIDFFPYGYDERQYCSPGFDLPVGCLMRTPHGQYPEYHTSADNLSLVQPEFLAASFEMYLHIVSVIENNKRYVNNNPKCEPQLGKRGLYKLIGGHEDSAAFQLAMLWVLNLSDGKHSLLDIAERANMGFRLIKDAAEALEKSSLLQELAG
jgi:aminopeptidase-like protein